jgi:hypothetical protein
MTCAGRALGAEESITMTMTFGIHVGHLGGPMDELRKLWRFADA